MDLALFRAALSSLDMNWARLQMPNATNDKVRLMAMHKERYECTDIDPDLSHESARWLRQRGLSRVTGDPILPAGDLPE